MPGVEEINQIVKTTDGFDVFRRFFDAFSTVFYGVSAVSDIVWTLFRAGGVGAPVARVPMNDTPALPARTSAALISGAHSSAATTA